MTSEVSKILKQCEKHLSDFGYIAFEEDIFSTITSEATQEIVRWFGSWAMMKLPTREIIFFEWLKEQDPDVWDDLWADTDEEPYIVSIGFLPLILDKFTGYPICDLLKNDNYYFTKAHLPDKESQIFLDSAEKRLIGKQSLTTAQLLAVTISQMPIDIWHFAYNNKIDLQKAKEAVQQLVEDKILVHFTSAEHLAPFIEF